MFQGGSFLTRGFCSQLTCSLKGIPDFFMNFVTKTAVGMCWSKLLSVADQVRRGKRPEHQQRIEEKAELYAWIQERAQAMLERM